MLNVFSRSRVLFTSVLEACADCCATVGISVLRYLLRGTRKVAVREQKCLRRFKEASVSALHGKRRLGKMYRTLRTECVGPTHCVFETLEKGSVFRYVPLMALGFPAGCRSGDDCGR